MCFVPIVVIALFLLFPVQLFPISITLDWNPNTESDLAGYKLYFGTAPGDYSTIINTGNVIEYTVDGFEIGTTYYFALSAFDNANNESGLSEEISYVAGSDLTDVLHLVRPNGGEKLRSGSSYTISWEAHPEIEKIRIWLSTDDGYTWEIIKDNAENTGSWTWDVPDILSDQCILKLEKQGNPNIYDYSDAYFTIDENGEDTDDDLCLLNPSGGEEISAGSSYTVEWSTPPEIEKIRIWLSTDDGYTWEIIKNRTLNDGKWKWTVPFLESGQCIMKLEKYGNPEIYDYSDECFTISGQLGVDDEEIVNLPRAIELEQNFPNPFNPSTQISYGLPEDESGSGLQYVAVTVYNARGKLVKRLVDDRLPPGRYTVHWDGKTDYGEDSPSGIYFYLLVVDGKPLPARKMLLAK